MIPFVITVPLLCCVILSKYGIFLVRCILNCTQIPAVRAVHFKSSAKIPLLYKLHPASSPRYGVLFVGFVCLVLLPC